MSIKAVSLRAWKGLNEEVSLEKFNLVTGPNGSGKTALLSSIAFAIEGKAPNRSPQLSEIAKFGSGGFGWTDITVACDDGFIFSRGISIDNHDGELKSFVRIRGKDGSLKAGNTVIGERFGKDGNLFAPMFDLDEFLTLSDDKRRAFVLDLCAQASPVSNCDWSDIRERIDDRFLEGRIGEGTLQMARRAGLDPLDKLNDSERDAYKSAWEQCAVADLYNLAVAVAGMIGSFNDVKLRAAKSKDEGRAAARKLSEQLSTLTPVARSAQELESDLADLRAKREELIKQIANQGGRESSIRAMQTELLIAEQSVKDAEAQLAKLAGEKPEEKDPDDLEAKAKAMTDAACEARPDPSRARAMVVEATKHLTTFTTTISQLEDQFRTCQSRVSAIETQLELLQGSDWAKIDRLLSDILAETPSPNVKWWNQVRVIIDRNLNPQRIQELQAQKLANEEEAARIATLVKESKDASVVARETEKKLLREHDAATIAEQEWLDRSRKTESQADALRREASRYRDVIGNWNTAHAQATVSQARASKNAIELIRRIETLRGDGGLVPAEQLVEQQSAVESTIKAHEDTLAAKRRYVALEEDYRVCLAKAEADEVLWSVAGDLCKAAKKVREELMDGLIQPLMLEVNAFLKAATGAPAYCNLVGFNDSPVFEIGWKADDEPRPFEALSGGEKVLMGAALAVALVKLADPKLKVLLLEAGECDFVTLAKLESGLESRCSDFANVLVATHLSVGEDIAGGGDWNHIERIKHGTSEAGTRAGGLDRRGAGESEDHPETGASVSTHPRRSKSRKRSA